MHYFNKQLRAAPGPEGFVMAARCVAALGFRFRTAGWSHLFQMKGSALPCSRFHFFIVTVSNYQKKTDANEIMDFSYVSSTTWP